MADVAHPLHRRVPKLLYLATALEAVGYGGIFALLAELQDEYNLPTAGLGMIAASSFLAGLVAQVTLARYADRGYTRLLLRLGLAVAAAGMLWFGLASSLWEFVVARLMLGLGSGMFVPAARRVVISYSGEKSGEGLGRLTSFEVGGFLCGPPIAAVLASLFGLHVPFIVFAAALALTSPAIARIDEPPFAPEPEPRAIRVLVANRGVRSGLALAAALYFSIGVFDAMWARYLTDLGASTALIAITLTLFALPLVLLSPLGGRLADKTGPLRSAVIAFSISVPLIAAYGFVSSIWIACIIAIGHTMSDSITTPAGQSAVARSAPPTLTAAGQGLWGAVAAAAAGVAALCAAPIYGEFGREAMWSATAVCVAGLTALAYFWGRGTPASMPNAPVGRETPASDPEGSLS